MRLTFSIDDQSVAVIDAAAEAIGATRSGWIAGALKRQIGSADAAANGEGRGKSRRKKGEARVHFRMSAEEFAQVEKAARAIGLTRTQFFVASARGRVWRDQDVIMNTPETARAMRDAIRELNAIGVNLNQAVRVLRGVLRGGGGMLLEQSMTDLVGQLEELGAKVLDTRGAIFAHLAAEQDGWRWR